MLVTYFIGDCPGCGAIKKFGNVSVRRDHILRGCVRCDYSEHIPLPPLRKKKLLYLDQFFFSNAFQARDSRFLAAIHRIAELSARQLLAVPFSSIHEDETQQWRGYNGKDKNDLMSFIKSTSRGHEFEPDYKVELTQISRAFQSFRDRRAPQFQLEPYDAVDPSVHEWEDYMQIDVGGYIGDIESLRDLRHGAVEALTRDVFANWRQSSRSFQEQVEIEIREAAQGYLKAYAEYLIRITSGDFNAVWNAPLLSGIVQGLVHMLPLEEPEIRIAMIGEFFDSGHFKQVPRIWITARIYATMKEMVQQGAYNDVADARNRLSGVFQDIEHISTYAPYCDGFFMDKAMAHLVKNPRIDLGKRFGVKVFSVNHMDEFMAWLDEIEGGMSSEHESALLAAYPPVIPQ